MISIILRDIWEHLHDFSLWFSEVTKTGMKNVVHPDKVSTGIFTLPMSSNCFEKTSGLVLLQLNTHIHNPMTYSWVTMATAPFCRLCHKIIFETIWINRSLVFETIRRNGSFSYKTIYDLIRGKVPKRQIATIWKNGSAQKMDTGSLFQIVAICLLSTFPRVRSHLKRWIDLLHSKRSGEGDFLYLKRSGEMYLFRVKLSMTWLVERYLRGRSHRSGKMGLLKR
jgi:hypothetical protein